MGTRKEYSSKLADKLMDVGNLAFAALIIGQLLGGEFQWGMAILGLGFWISTYAMAYLLVGVRWRRRD